MSMATAWRVVAQRGFRAAVLMALGIAALCLTVPAGAAVDSTAGQPASTNLLAKIYQTGNGRLSRGDMTGAAAVFKLIAEIAPELPEAQYGAALATLLADFGKRETTLPMIVQAAAGTPGNPLAKVLSVFADPQLSSLRGDGALYVSAAGAARLRAAEQQLQSYAAARNGRYVAAFLGSAQATGDTAFPLKFADFGRVTGQGGKFRLPQWTEDVVFGQIFILTVPEARFAPYEPRLIARLQNGLKSLESSQSRLSHMRSRLQELRAQLDTTDPKKRVVAIANLDRLLAQLNDLIATNEQTVSSLKLIVDSVGANQEIAKRREELRKQDQKIAAMRSIGKALDRELTQKKAAISDAERQRIAAVAKMNAAQKKLNGLEAKLAQTEVQLARSQQTASAAEQTMQQRNAELAKIKAREEVLRKQQLAAEQLETSRQQQAAAAAQLDQLHAQIKQAEETKRGNLQALHRQETTLTAKLAALQADVAAGEAARLKAEQSKQELAQLQARKAKAEGDIRAEEERLAQVRGERDRLQHEVAAMRAQQEKQLAEHTRLAGALKEVNFGRYFALIIGNDEYREWPPLQTAVNDARDLADLLSRKYGFKVTLLTNATRSQILTALDDMSEELGPSDNLLVYYAGHGIIDRNGTGYWVPVDGDAYARGKTLRTQNFVKHEDVIAAIRRMKAKQVMVVADSCFSGGLATLAAATPVPPPKQAFRLTAVRTRGLRVVDSENGIPVNALQGTTVRADAPAEMVALSHWASRAARVVLTSGGNEPVVDQLKPGDRHSIFAAALLESLSKNKGLLKSIELTDAVQEKVVRELGGISKRGAGAAAFDTQTPTFNNLLGYNGEFLFVARN